MNKFFWYLVCIKYDSQRLSKCICLIGKVMKTIGFLDLETSEASDDTISNSEEGACGLPKDRVLDCSVS